MAKATWTVYLLNRHEEPSRYFAGLREGTELNNAVSFAVSKVLDGSDADAMLVTRTDNYRGMLSDLWDCEPDRPQTKYQKRNLARRLKATLANVKR